MLSLCDLLYLFWTIQHISSSNRITYSCASCARFHLHKSLLSRFVLPEVVADSSNDLDSIDICGEENLKDLYNIYIGHIIKQFTWENDLIGTARYRKFLSESRKLFQWYVTYLSKSMPVLKNGLIKTFTFIRLPDRQKATLDELSILVTRFPNFIPQEDITQLETEFFKYQCTSEKELPSYLDEDKIPSRTDFIWNEIAKISHPCNGQPKFKHPPKLVKFLLLIPHSTAYCEIVFSTVKKICTDDRHDRQRLNRNSC